MLRKRPIFETSCREQEFLNLCDKLKRQKPDFSWNMFNLTDVENSVESEDEVVEFSIPDFSDDAKNLISNDLNSLKMLDVSVSCASDNEILTQEKIPLEKEAIYKLKQLLMTIQDGSIFEQPLNELSIVSRMPSVHVPMFCEMLDISSLSDTAVAAFLTVILQLEKPISLTTATALALHAVYPKVHILNNNSSRALLTAILSFSEMYPKAITDEVIIQCLTKSSLDSMQLDFMLKIVKNYLPPEQIIHCIKNILKPDIPTENMFTSIQCLIEKKIPLEKSLHDDLASKIEKWDAEYSSDLKFTRMLLSILTIYGSQLSKKQLSLYGDVVKNNKTILRRAAENLLKKLQKN